MLRWAGTLGWVSLVLLVAGPPAAHIELVPPVAGFGVFMLGGLLGLVASVLGAVAAFRQGGAERGKTLLKAAPAIVVTIVVIVLAVRSAGYPRINDITTDTENPPQFVFAKTLPANSGRDLDYPGEEFAIQQRAGYPDLGPLKLDMPAPTGFLLAHETVRRIGWKTTQVNHIGGTIEGTRTSWLFRFQDDYIVVVRPVAGGSEIHMRSKSRDGKGDLGANAAWIRELLEAIALKAEVGRSTRESYQ